MFDALLKALEANDGACLYWQLCDSLGWREALERGVVLFCPDSDLLVHPKAVRVGDGCYVMVQSA